jgi:WD40 repeat protein
LYAKAIILFSLFTGSSLFSAEKITYEDHIKEIFQNSCSNCHKPSKKKGGLNLMIYSDVLKGGSSGKAIESGNLDSLLIKCITHEEEPIMPPKGPKLTDKEIELIKQWITAGLLENTKSKRVKSSNQNITMSMPTIPQGQVIMPKYLNIEPHIQTAKANAVTAMAASPYSPLVAIGAYKQVLLLNTTTMDMEGILTFDEGQIYDLKFSRDGSIVLASGGLNGKTGSVVLWNVKTGKRLTQLSPDFDTTLTADISSDRHYLATGSSDKLVKIFSLASGDLIHSIKQHSEWVTNVSISPDGVLVASGDRNGHIYVWEVESGQKLYTMMHHKKDITALSWRADSNLLAASSEDGEVSIWNIINGRKVKNFKAHTNGTTDVFYTNKGHLVTCGRDQQAKVYDTKYKQVKTLKTTSKLPLKIIGTTDAKNVLYSDLQGKINKWNLQSGKIIHTLTANPPSLSESLLQLQIDVEKLHKSVNQSKEKLIANNQKIDAYNELKKQPNLIKQEIIKLKQVISNESKQISKEKDQSKKANLTQSLANKKKKMGVLNEELKRLDLNIRKQSKPVQNFYKSRILIEKNITIKNLTIHKKMSKIVRHKAEKTNSERHQILNNINALLTEIDNSKYSIKDLHSQIKNNEDTIDKLTKLEGHIGSEMSEDEALATLVKRYEKIQQLKRQMASAAVEITEAIKIEPKLKAQLPSLIDQEKILLKNYLEQLQEKNEQVKK